MPIGISFIGEVLAQSGLSVQPLSPRSPQRLDSVRSVTVSRIWKELAEEFEEDLQWLNITKDSIWNAARDREMGRPLTPAERKLIESGQSTESMDQAVSR